MIHGFEIEYYFYDQLSENPPVDNHFVLVQEEKRANEKKGYSESNGYVTRWSKVKE